MLLAVRRVAATHLPFLVFFACYSFLVVAGNFGFAIYGKEFAPLYPLGFFDSHETFSAGFWALLLAPYVLIPPFYVLFRRFLLRPVTAASVRLIDINVAGYIVLLGVLLSWVAWRLIASNAFGLIRGATNDISSIEARFEILGRLGFAVLAVLQSLLPFLVFVALVKAIRSGRPVWWALTTIAVVGTTFELVALNMKWPVVVLYLGIAIAVFSFASRWVYLSTASSLVVLFGVYFLIASFVFRIAPPPPPTHSPPQIETPQKPADTEVSSPSRDPRTKRSTSDAKPSPSQAPPSGSDPTPTGFQIEKIVASAAVMAPLFIKQAIIRLAIIYPYYYEVFTTEGPVCGGLIEQARVGPSCRPAKLIYSRMYPDDMFQNRGTANISVHVSSYALGGWPLALVSLVAAALVLASFSCLPLEGNATSGALRVLGAQAAYHLTQVPGEGVVFYDHGLLWVALLLGLCKLAELIVRRVSAWRSVVPPAGLEPARPEDSRF